MRQLLVGMFLISLSMGIAGIAIPLYADELGASYTEIGMLGVTYVIFNSLFSIPVGRWGDRRGRKLSLVVGFFLTAFVILIYPIFGLVAWLILLRLFQGAVEAPIWVNAPGAVADLSHRDGRGRAMGAYGASWAIAFGVGPLIGGTLYAFFGAAWTFIFGAVLGFLATAIVSSMPPTKPRDSGKKIKLGGLLSVSGAGLVYVGISAIIFILFPVYATKGLGVGGLGMTKIEAGLIITIYTALRAVFFMPLGGLSDRIGGRRMILAGLLGIALASAGISITSGFFGVAVIVALMSIAGGAVFPAMMSVVSKAGEGRDLGYVLGLFNSITVLGWAIFPGVGGALADAYGPTSPFLMYAVVALAATLLLWRLLPKK